MNSASTFSRLDDDWRTSNSRTPPFKLQRVEYSKSSLMTTIKERKLENSSSMSQEEQEYCNYCKIKLERDIDGFNLSFSEFEEPPSDEH
jgi:hypothetical protein